MGKPDITVLWNNFFARLFLLYFIPVLILTGCGQDKDLRTDNLLNEGWKTIAADSLMGIADGFLESDYDDSGWKRVNIPHNWDDYFGYRRLLHGNRHGYAWYRKVFSVEKTETQKRYFLCFEGVGSYASVWLNQKKVGYHAGGRTSFTLDITDALAPGRDNILVVRADHPANIRDLPWVCGGCSPEWGFSEGSQPMGIFRPVHLVITAPLRIEPFGVHVWNDEGAGTIFINSEIKNYTEDAHSVELINKITDRKGRVVKYRSSVAEMGPGEKLIISQNINDLENPHLWSPGDPYLYNLVTEINLNGATIDRVTTPFGIRWIKWDIEGDSATGRFYLNGEPFFINGNAEYEHLLGQSHAFSLWQIRTRVSQFTSAGFNAFRDAHQPHNLRYQQYWDSLGILWWPQMAAHIWFDNPAFRDNFKQLLSDWIKERRNSPSVILWGLMNESTLPEDFARECSDLIRKLDPTASSQRKITTCNGGAGTDWNIPQNWSGTYGGNPALYAEELKRQALNGEYGAWRSLGLHTEGGFVQDGLYSEDRFCLLMESKIRLADSVSQQSCGHFHWLFASHENPGRIQGGEGIRDIDRLGPVNYKGLLTVWGEPTDGYYLYRSNFAPKESEPMVYIVSHTWEDRWIESGLKNGIRVFSNCDEVELFNGTKSLGRKNNPGRGFHFVWDSVEITNNLLHAAGYVNKRKVAEDCIVLNHLNEAENLTDFSGKIEPVLKNVKGRRYLYRVNCGGPDYTDSYGNLWTADLPVKEGNIWGSGSWTDHFADLPSFYGSQRYTRDPIKGTLDWPLFQDFRFGRNFLKYIFSVPEGEYFIDLFFIEPWYGTGGGLDCRGWRVFDVAVNGKTVIDDLDIWSEAGHDHVLKKTIRTYINEDQLEVSFPEVLSGQAVISAIAISSENVDSFTPSRSQGLVKKIIDADGMKKEDWRVKYWLSTGAKHYMEDEAGFFILPAELFGAEWILTPAGMAHLQDGRFPGIVVNDDVDFYIGIPGSNPDCPEWMDGFINTGEMIGSTYNRTTYYTVFKKRYYTNDTITPGPNNLSGKEDNLMFTMVFQPATDLDPPIDFRETKSCEAEDAFFSSASQVLNKSGKESVLVRGDKGYIAWEISVGIASRYGLEFRYMNPSGSSVFADLRIISDAGPVAYEGEVEFLPSGTRWKSLKTDTRTAVNAGNYRIVIAPQDHAELFFDWIKVQ